jgi:sugar phosphate isomerase/epimerase
MKSLSGLEAAKKNGFGIVQLPVDAIMALDATAFDREQAGLKSSGLSFQVFESPLPRDVQVTEAGFNIYHWTEYLGQALIRLSALGCKTLVWGDGKARLLPVEGEMATSKERFYQFMFLLCDNAAKYGITVGIQPLGGKRTNFLNSMAETADSIAMVGKPNLGMAVSLRDLVEMQATMEELVLYKALVKHLQIENPAVPGTLVPPKPGDAYEYSRFFKALQAMDYAGTLSLPAGSDGETLKLCMDLQEHL